MHQGTYKWKFKGITKRSSSRRKNQPEITLDQITALFHLKITDAVKVLNVPQSYLKKIIRQKYGIARWPQRKVRLKKISNPQVMAIRKKLQKISGSDDIDEKLELQARLQKMLSGDISGMSEMHVDM